MAEKSVTIEGWNFTDINKKSRKTVKQKPKSNSSLKKQLIQRLAKYRSDLGANSNTSEHHEESNTFDTTMNTLNLLEDNYQKSKEKDHCELTPFKLNLLETDVNSNLKTDQKEPNYGCLKKGNKKTLKQIKNHQSQHNVMFKPTNASIYIDQIDNRLKERQKLFLDMKERRTKELNQESNEITAHPFQNTQEQPLENKGGKVKKTKRVKKIKKTCKIGKYDGKVVILLPNKKTRKKIHDDIIQIDTIPVYKIKEYLRSKKLIKAGCTAPENVLRETMKNTILSGDVEKDKECIQISDMLE